MSEVHLLLGPGIRPRQQIRFRPPRTFFVRWGRRRHIRRRRRNGGVAALGVATGTSSSAASLKERPFVARATRATAADRSSRCHRLPAFNSLRVIGPPLRGCSGVLGHHPAGRLDWQPPHLWRPPPCQPWPCPVPRRFATSSGSFARSTATCSPLNLHHLLLARVVCLLAAPSLRSGRGRVGWAPHRRFSRGLGTARPTGFLPQSPLPWALLWSFMPSCSTGSETPQPQPPPPLPQRGVTAFGVSTFGAGAAMAHHGSDGFCPLRPPRVGLRFGFGFPCAGEMQWATQ
jgi:hypothetical protein